MYPDLPPLTWLRAFEASARTLSFTEAGRELNLTQAAVSKHVKSLELHLRHQLFHRRPRSLELTKSGVAYLPKVRDSLVETIKPLCSPEMSKRLASPEDLANERIIHVLGYQEGWGVWLKAAGAKTVDPGRWLQLDTSLAAFEMAINGAGVALGRKSLSGTVESSGRLVAPFDLEVPIDEAFHLIAPIAAGGHPDAATFVEWITSAAALEGVR
jgi:DNA-binding transcriptional LysR family regulator